MRTFLTILGLFFQDYHVNKCIFPVILLIIICKLRKDKENKIYKKSVNSQKITVFSRCILTKTFLHVAEKQTLQWQFFPRHRAALRWIKAAPHHSTLADVFSWVTLVMIAVSTTSVEAGRRRVTVPQQTAGSNTPYVPL